MKADRQPEQVGTDSAAGRLRKAIVSVNGRGFSDGNSIEVLRNGDEIFPAMLAAIRAARNSVDLVTFVYWEGEIARRFARTISDQAKKGVRVRVILDGFGSKPMDQELVDEMRSAGAEVIRFRPVVRWKLWENDHRTHRKILVCDNEVAFTGGVGIAQEWEGDATDASEWRDTHFRVEGPVVDGLRAAFLTDWRDTDRRIALSDLTHTVEEKPGACLATTIDASAQIGLNDAERTLEAIIEVASHQILIQTPYFNPTRRVRELLIEAVTRGVDIEVMIPGPHIDKRVSEMVAKERLHPLIKAGIRVWEFQPTMLHTKVVVVDEVLSVVGSVNLNRRSVEKDEEVALAVLDEALSAGLIEDFERDRSRSVAVEIVARWRRLLGKLLAPLRSEM